MTQLISIQPDFNALNRTTVEAYNRFYQYTEDTQLNTSLNLDELTELTKNAYGVITHANPYHDDTQFQWNIDHLSDIKVRLSHAIEKKRAYYDENFLGIITKFFLQLFSMWNEGETPCIQKAVDFELFWDSEHPVMRITHPDHHQYGEYTPRQDFPPANVDLSNFYNYRRE